MGASQAAGVQAFPRQQKPVIVFVITTLRLIVPVAALTTVLLAIWLRSEALLSVLDPYAGFVPPVARPGLWLTEGALLVALAFFVVTLANRRYGLGLALLQIVVGWVLAAIIVTAAINGIVPPIPGIDLPGLPPLRPLAILVAALIAAQVVSAAMFNWTRGGAWWRAPLYAGLWGAVVFCGIYYPATMLPGDQVWAVRLALHLALLVVIGLVLLVPYYLMRPFIRPLGGYGGY